MTLRNTFTVGLLSLFAITALVPMTASADAVTKGNEVAAEWNRRDLGFGDTRATMEMVLENRNGQTSTRRMRMSTLEVPNPDEGDKTLTVFQHPRDIKGTAFLSFSHINDPDDQWLYLPALKRVKRISSKNKSGPFVGSEFAYEDLSAQELKKYTYTSIREEACGELTCAVIEQVPTYENSGYTKMVVWYDLAEYRQQKIDYYDRKKQLVKTLEFSNFQQHLDKYWRAYDMFMVNHQTGKKTRLVFSKYEFQIGLKERDMTKNALKRIR
ncbi:MAG: outer membrane lipoprotein-sorting protein [Magnetovibrio sp.]|nr:outer membrane lipoprotein-sorting protein [Magnetovibrio sp.]